MSLVKSIPVLLFTVVVIQIAVSQNVGAVHVMIANQLPAGAVANLKVHCNSYEGKAIGDTTIASARQLNFDVQPNSMTVYHCVVSSPKAELKLDVYDFKRDHGERCQSECTWLIREDGIHGYNQKTRVEDLFLAWGPILN